MESDVLYYEKVQLPSITIIRRERLFKQRVERCCDRLQSDRSGHSGIPFGRARQAYAPYGREQGRTETNSTDPK